MNQKAQQKLKTRQAILASAARLLRQQGIQGSSLMDVMRGAGLTVGGFYAHFDSKENLFADTIRAETSTMWHRLLGTATGTSPPERAFSVLRRYLSRRHRDQPDTGCVLPGTVPDVVREGEPYRSALQGGLAGLVDSFATLLGGEASGREQALALIALMYGTLSLSRALAGTALSDEFLRAGQTVGKQVLEEGLAV